MRPIGQNKGFEHAREESELAVLKNMGDSSEAEDRHRVILFQGGISLEETHGPPEDAVDSGSCAC